MQQITLNVKVLSILFSNDDYFHILRVELLNNNGFETTLDKTFFAKGITGNIVIDQTYEIQGFEVDDPKYGKQFNIQNIKHYVEQNEKSVTSYLSSDLFPKIGTVTAQKIVDTLGVEAVELIEQDPNIVKEKLDFLTPNQQEILKESIFQNAYIEKIFSFFKNYITLDLATKIFLSEGIDALEKYSKNPYLLFINYQRINLANIDKFALENKICEFNSQIRLEGFIYKIVKDLNGHTFISQKDLKALLRRNSINDFTFLEDALINLGSQKLVSTFDDNVAYYVNYKYEKNISYKVKSFVKTNNFEVNIDRELEVIQKSENIEYNEKQLEAIINVFNNNISIITGGPGTGKTTIINAITKIYKDLFPDNLMALVAPTGKAATRMGELADKKAQTVHSLLKISVSEDKAKYNMFNKLDEKLIILDEASMVDVEVFSKLMDAINNDATIVIVGDVNQLSSVGPGQVLSDLISSGLVKTTKLDVIQRQKENSNIIKLAQDVLKGELDKNMFKTKHKDFEYYQIRDNQTFAALDAILKKEMINFDKDDIQIITPRRNASNVTINSTVNSINKHVQPIFNDNDTFLFTNGFHKFFLHDRIINNENMNEKNVANGDQGFLDLPVFKHKKLDRVSISFDSNIVEFNQEELKKIDLAYATTVHKSQGSEYKLVILFVLPEHGHMISKKLIYTAITRAKEKIIICGNYDYISNAILNVDFEHRNTKLVEFLGEWNG